MSRRLLSSKDPLSMRAEYRSHRDHTQGLGTNKDTGRRGAALNLPLNRATFNPLKRLAAFNPPAPLDHLWSKAFLLEMHETAGCDSSVPLSRGDKVSSNRLG